MFTNAAKEGSMRFLTMGGDTFHVEADLIEGAPTVVCIHPLGADLRVFDELAVRLAKARIGCLRYDLRGHGLSDLGKAPGIADDHAADLAGLMQLAGIRRATICGVSVGGLIAQALYRLRPDLVERLLLASTGAKIGTPEAWNQRIAAARGGGVASLAESVLQRWFSAADYARGDGLVALCRHMLSGTSAEGYAATCAVLRDSDLTGALAAISVPTLCVAGEFDGSTPPEFVRALQERIPGSRFLQLSGAGHVPPLQSVDAFASALIEFVAGGAA
jgi:3-oxoadipate enol-lactonase